MKVDRRIVVVGGFGAVVVGGLAGEDVDVVGAGVVAFDPLGEGELAAGARGQDGADLAVGVAGQGAVHASPTRLVMVTGSSVEVFFTTKVKVTFAAGLRHRRRVRGLGDLDRRQHVGEVDRGVVVVGGFGVVVVDGLAP